MKQQYDPIMELEQLYAKRDDLANAKLGDMTLGEANAKLQELQDVEAKIRQTEYNSRFAHQATAKQIQSTVGDMDAKTQKQPRVSEINIGRYIMTILAALLCLGAFGVFITMLWGNIPEVGKFVLFLALGIGLEALGAWRANKQSMRPFWLGVAGVGAGISFIDLTFGSLVWGIGNIILIGVFVLAWFLANMALGRKQEAGLYYIIAFAGGLEAVGLASSTMVADCFGEIVLCILTAAIAISGAFEFKRSKKQYILICELLFCFAISSVMNDLQIPVNNAVEIGIIPRTPYIPVVLPWFCCVLGALSLYLTRFLDISAGKLKTLLKSAAIFVLSFSVCEAARYAAGGSIESLGLVLALGIILACGIKTREGYALGIVWSAMEILSALSANITEAIVVRDMIATCEALLPCIAFMGLVLLPKILNRWDNRLAVVVAGVFAFGTCGLTYGVEWTGLFVLSWTFLVVGVAMYAYRAAKENIWFKKPLDILALLTIPGLLVAMLKSFKFVPIPGALASAIVIVGMYVYWFVYLQHQENTGAEKVFWYIIRIIAYLALLANMIFADTPDKIVITAAMMVTLGFNLYRAVIGRTGVQSVAACLLANWNLFWLVRIWNVNDYGILISLIGILIAAGFIAFGFVFKLKSSRQVGLGCAVLYAIKLGLFDIGSSSAIGAAGGLLIAGLLCFGISLAYHRLGLRYSEASVSEV